MSNDIQWDKGEEIVACPECGNSHIFTASKSDYQWRCGKCKARFDQPASKIRGSSTGPNKGTLARELMQSDPDVIGGASD